MSAETPVGDDQRAVAGVVRRARLIELLDTRWPPLVVVRAPSGAGKTTLLRTWAVSRTDDTPLLWVTINAEVASPAAFWALLIEAGRRNGDLSAETAAALAEQITWSADPAGIAVDFLRQVGPVVLVLDAYEKVGEAVEEIDRDLLRLTEELPQVRVVVAARGRTGLAADGLRLRDRVHVIDDHQLAFTAAETEELLRVHLGREDPDLAARTLHATRGYALAVRALVMAMSRRTSIPAGDSDEWRQLVATDLRAALPDEEAARFVALTSVAPYCDVVLASRLTGRPDAEQMLALLERQGFGRWIPYARQHPVFQYADSIRDAFGTELRSGDGVEHRRAAGIAARWLFEYGDHDMAFDLALAASDHALAARVYVDLLRLNPECYLTDRLLGPLSSLPVRVLKQHPILAFALGLARWTSPVLRTSAPAAMLLAVSHQSRTTIVSPDVDGFVNKSVRAVSLRLMGRFTDATRSSRVAIAEIDRLSAERVDEFGELIAMILRQLSYSLLQGGAYDEAVATMYRSAALTKVASTRNCALAYATGTHAYLGDLPAARAARAQLDPQGWPLEAQLSYLNAMTVIGEGLLDLDALDFEAALERVTSAVAFTDTTEFWAFFTLVAVHAQIGLGRGLAAARHVESRLGAAFPPQAVGDNTATRTLLGLQAIGWLAGGRIAKAERILAGASPRVAELVPARVLHLILTERSGVAVERLSRWLALPRHTVRTRAATLVLGAAAARRSGEDRLAVTLAVRAHDLYAEHGVNAHLTFLPAEDRCGLAGLAARAGATDTAAYLRSVAVDVIPATVPQVVLSGTELAVLAELAGTGSREQIAGRLGVSVNTVKSHLRRIYRKLGVSDRAAALGAASEYELLESGLERAAEHT